MKYPRVFKGARFLAILVLIACGIASAQAAPANDLFANRTILTATNRSGWPLTNIVVTGLNSGATREAGEPSHAGVPGGASVWWSWKAPREGTVTISTAGSDFDTVLAVYTGTSLTNLFEEASNDDEDYDNLIYASRVVFDVAAHQTCQIAVDGYNGETGYIRLSVELGPLGRRGSAPKWALPDPNGVLVRSSSYVGKVMILNFWATWSELCSAEMADLVGLQEKYRNSGLVVVGANVSWSDDTTAAVRSFLATHVPAINYPIIMSTNNLEEPYRGVREIPATFIIDRDNDIRRTIVGQPSRATLEHAITPLLFNHMRLESRYSANHLVLRWPTNMIPFLLQSSKNPASGWTPWKGSVRVSSGTNTISVDMNGPPRFFRLQTAE